MRIFPVPVTFLKLRTPLVNFTGEKNSMILAPTARSTESPGDSPQATFSGVEVDKFLGESLASLTDSRPSRLLPSSRDSILQRNYRIFIRNVCLDEGVSKPHVTPKENSFRNLKMMIISPVFLLVMFHLVGT